MRIVFNRIVSRHGECMRQPYVTGSEQINNDLESLHNSNPLFGHYIIPWVFGMTGDTTSVVAISFLSICRCNNLAINFFSAIFVSKLTRYFMIIYLNSELYVFKLKQSLIKLYAVINA